MTAQTALAGLVDREPMLRALQQRLEGARERGHLVLLSGEAGIGKTSLLRALADAPGSARAELWWGACDALQTPLPLAPLLDIARERRVRWADRLAGPRAALFDALLDELRGVADPVLFVIEDAHWADDATLDLLKFLGRRIERTHALLVVSYRDDELPAAHPLRGVIGELPGAARTHIELPRLSPQAVETLARRALRAPAGLHAATRGNPFFVAELLRHPMDALPPSVKDLVLARYARQGAAVQAIVRLAAVMPGGLERWLLDATLAAPLADIEACLDSGLLLADGATLRFRHELARVAIESSLAVPVAQALHAQVLAAAASEAAPRLPPARLAHHAALAGDDAALRRHAPAAGDQARERGAFREAALHYGSALRVWPAGEDGADGAPLDLLEHHAEACDRIDRIDDSIRARERLVAAHRRRGDAAALGRHLTMLARPYVSMGRNAEADAASREAIALLEALPASSDLANAYGTEATLRMLNRDCEASMDWSRKAIALAESLGDRVRLIGATSTLGTAQMFLDHAAGLQVMEQALRMALDAGLLSAAAITMLNIGSASGELIRLDVAEPWLRRAVDYATEHEDDRNRHYASAWLALCDLLAGRWDDAAERALPIATRPGISAISRVMALLALGRLRTRRGDPGADAVLDEAYALSRQAQTLQRIAPVRAARAEAAWARGDADAAAAEAQAALPLALRHGHAWFIGELAYWAWRAGRLDRAPAGCAEPYALQIGGDWRAAAAAWQRLGCPYEQARALADGDAAARVEALARFEGLGARPAADALRRELARSGVRGLVRGPRRSTAARPYGLTTRELEVLQHLCAGLRNADIAQRLSRSVRTVDHHVAAVYAKLGVETRLAAVQAAQRAGLAQDAPADRAPAQSGQAGRAK